MPYSSSAHMSALEGIADEVAEAVHVEMCNKQTLAKRYNKGAIAEADARVRSALARSQLINNFVCALLLV